MYARIITDMNALNNADIVTGNACDELTPIAPPAAKSSRSGVSVEYAYDESGEKQWFLFRASYGREDMAADILTDMGVYTYVPKRREVVVVNGKRRSILRNLMPNFVFAYLAESEARVCVRGVEADKTYFDSLSDDRQRAVCILSSFLSFYYDHFHQRNGVNPPLVVPQSEMMNLIYATMSHNENVLLLQEGKYTFKGDEEVEVIHGEFKGVRGRVVRAGRQQRVRITLTGFGAIATAYVPSAFLRRVASE